MAVGLGVIVWVELLSTLIKKNKNYLQLATVKHMKLQICANDVKMSANSQQE